MSWSSDEIAGIKRVYNLAPGTALAENGLLGANNGTVYSSAFKLGEDLELKLTNFLTENDDATAGSAKTVDFHLYGCETEGGTYVLVKSTLVTQYAASTAANTVKVGQVDLSSYPYPFMKVGVVSTGDESANHFRIVMSQTVELGSGEVTIGGTGPDPS